MPVALAADAQLLIRSITASDSSGSEVAYSGRQRRLHLGHIDVLPDDGGALAAQLQRDGLDVLAGRRTDDAADLGAASERDLRPKQR